MISIYGLLRKSEKDRRLMASAAVLHVVSPDLSLRIQS